MTRCGASPPPPPPPPPSPGTLPFPPPLFGGAPSRAARAWHNANGEDVNLLVDSSKPASQRGPLSLRFCHRGVHVYPRRASGMRHEPSPHTRRTGLEPVVTRSI
ncbi:hypothetical protein LX36DRAFT_391301 [Colletotrichum falcatum]|nr:hypothetical protein LX36DRAFT_391301 [Colletotrichum falcatum]